MLILTLTRTTGLTAWLVRSVMYGNTVRAWVFLKQTPKKTTFISSAKIANAEKKMRRSLRSQVSNFTSDLHPHHPNRNQKLSFQARTRGKSASQARRGLNCPLPRNSRLWTAIITILRARITLVHSRTDRMICMQP